MMHRVPALQQVAHNPAIRSIVESILSPEAFVVRTTLFDKTDSADWKVPWHQDATIAVSQRLELEGYGPWSTKGGIVHVQPPTEILERMVTVRVHLDPCPSDNGALRVMPGTHTLGRINQNDAAQYVSEDQAVCCEVEAGAALVMRSAPSRIITIHQTRSSPCAPLRFCDRRPPKRSAMANAISPCRPFT